jgi:hypothetical protein
MYIQKIEIENVRGFEKVDLDLTRPDGSFAGWTVIAGRNGSGKTTFLRAVALSVAAVSTALKFDDSYADGWVRAGAKAGHAHAHILRSAGDRWKRGVKLTPLAPNAFWTGLDWASHRDPTLRANRKLNEKGLRNAPLRGPCAESPSGWFLAGYGSFRRIAGEAPSAQRDMRGPQPIARLVTLFREEASLVVCVKWLQNLDYQSKDKRPGAARLKRDVLRILDDGLLPDLARIDHVDSDGLWVKCAGIPLLHTQMSDGYKTVTALVLDILKNLEASFGRLNVSVGVGCPRVTHHGVVLIDEIDAHLHPSWQKRIGFWLKQHFPNIQFIVTTHSPFICQAADPNGLIRLPAPGSNERAALVPEPVYNLVVNGSVDDAIMSELFGRERPYSDAAEALREDISRLGARLIEGAATPEEKTLYQDLSAKLPKTPSAQVERALLELTAELKSEEKKGARKARKGAKR